ncbi:MAG: hydrogenase nickel incorporation protein HypB [Desulfuromonadales bacterium]|nr:hydrogenase nickel incorporation protein HypB [Desulfuromonadales bacterium]
MCTDCGCGPSGHHHHHHPPVAELSPGRVVRIEEDLLAKNNRLAAGNRRFFQEKGLLVYNLVSSPGSGKTTLLERTLSDLQHEVHFAVLEGDQQTSNDAERIAATGVPAVQINTGSGCHLDAHMVGHGMENFAGLPLDILMIENVGNLVCPASFDLGEDAKIALLSVTEGEDKPLKYPDMFKAADILLLTKIDLLPYLRFDIEQCKAFARQVNPQVRIFELSCQSGVGLSSWYDWLRQELAAKRRTARDVSR